MGEKITPETITRLENEVRAFVEQKLNMKALPPAPIIMPNPTQYEPSGKLRVPVSNTFGNNFEQNQKILNNTKQLPSPAKNLVTPNTQGTPNFRVTGSTGDVGGMRQRLPKNK